jgi:hypothetical protein
MILELELVGNADDILLKYNPDVPGDSKTWSIQNVQVKCDVLSLDSQLNNNFFEVLKEGSSLPIPFSSFSVSQHVLNGNENTINISRSVSRLKTIFITLFKDSMGIPARGADGVLNLAQTILNQNVCNSFYHPCAGTGTQFITAHSRWNTPAIEWYIQIGSRRFPEYPITSTSETFYQLRKALGIHHSKFHAIDLNVYSYHSNHHLMAIDLEKSLGVSYTGENTKHGELITIHLKNTGGAQYAFVTLHYDAILELRDTGCVLIE